jgi:hypothetical protein
MAHQQNGETSHEQYKADRNPQPIPPTHIVIDPSPAIENLKAQADDEKKTSKSQPVPQSARREWATVIITGIYAFIAAWTLVAINRQASWAKRQAKSMEDQLAEMSRQTDWLIERERPRLNIELGLFDPLQQPNTEREYCVTGSVSIYGHTVAEVRKAEISVSTMRFVPEEAFELYGHDVSLADFAKSPDRIDIPRIIRPNNYDIGFTTPVYSGHGQVASIDEIKAVLRYRGALQSAALYCRAKIEYSASDKTWIEQVRLRLCVFADPYTVAVYGYWEEYGENQQGGEGNLS